MCPNRQVAMSLLSNWLQDRTALGSRSIVHLGRPHSTDWPPAASPTPSRSSAVEWSTSSLLSVYAATVRLPTFMFVSKHLDAAGRGGGCWGGTRPDQTLLG